MKKILLFSVVLALVMALVVPTAALAAKPKPFEAAGIFTSIDEGDVTVLETDENGNAVLYQVENRHIQGQFVRDAKCGSNRITGPFTITYDAVVNAYQAGEFSGKLKAKSATFRVEGTSYGITGYDPDLGYRVDMAGSWTGIKSIKAAGEFTAYFYFAPAFDEEGNMHVGTITDSSFEMEGVYTK